MTRKHYQQLAAAFAASKPDKQTLHRVYGLSINEINARLDQWRNDVISIANSLEEDNARFNPQRFYQACGLEES